jgi:hypothetical protein
VQYVRSIPVEDASGCRFQVHEFTIRRLLSRASCFILDTGQRVDIADMNTFEIASTGETLVRAADSSQAGPLFPHSALCE